MVEYSIQLNSVFSSLADPTRRDILRRVARKELSVSEIAQSYKLTFAAVSKHLTMLEKARLIHKRQEGRQHMISLSPRALKGAATYLRHYDGMWRGRLDSLEHYLDRGKTHVR
ncbi:MAG: metalloregulator ArsR/SmtB family transcription factor [bacterium]|nr:metalloregulator ArsR/SmtB family transcription factor [bacterium]